MRKPTFYEIKNVMTSLDMKIFTKPFDMNLGAIRTIDNKANTFNDWIFMFYHDKQGNICGVVEEGTTDAGLYYRTHPMTPKGTCIIAHSRQYRGAFTYMEVGGHRGQEAFRQTGGIDYYLDNNKDEYLDFVNLVLNKIFNTNGHDMGTLGNKVNNWSAGCWGAIQRIMDKLYLLAKLQIKHGLGAKFTFTMLHENDFK